MNWWGVLISRHLSVKHFPLLRFHWRLFVAQKPPSGFCFHCGACCCICYVIIATSRQRDTVQLTNNCSVALINSGTLSHKGEEWLLVDWLRQDPPIFLHSTVHPTKRWNKVGRVDAGFMEPSLLCIGCPLNICGSRLVPYPQLWWDYSKYWRISRNEKPWLNSGGGNTSPLQLCFHQVEGGFGGFQNNPGSSLFLIDRRLIYFFYLEKYDAVMSRSCGFYCCQWLLR